MAPCAGRASLRLHLKWIAALKQVVVGTACTESRHMLDISYPVSNGQVRDWGAMERVWDHTFEHILKLDAAARARTYILLTEPPLNPLSNRQVRTKQARWRARWHYTVEMMTETLGATCLSCMLMQWTQCLKQHQALDCMP